MKNNLTAQRREETIAPAETSEQKFIRLANKRVPKFVKYFRTLGNLGAYESRSDQVEQIVDFIEELWGQTKVRLRNHQNQESTFHLH